MVGRQRAAVAVDEYDGHGDVIEDDRDCGAFVTKALNGTTQTLCLSHVARQYGRLGRADAMLVVPTFPRVWMFRGAVQGRHDVVQRGVVTGLGRRRHPGKLHPWS